MSTSSKTAPVSFSLLALLCAVLLSHPSSGVPIECRQWQIVDQPAAGDYAIVESALYITSLDHTDPGGNYEMWGFFEAKHNDYIMGKLYFGSPTAHKVCEISDLGGPKNWATTVVAAVGSAGLAVATGGASTIVQAGAAGIAGIAASAAVEYAGQSDTCSGGLLGMVSYPVSYHTDTWPYNFYAEIVEHDSAWSWFTSGNGDEKYYVNTAASGEWSQLDECWDRYFENKLIEGKVCTQTVDVCETYDCRKPYCTQGGCEGTTSSAVGKAEIQTVIKAWVRGPLVDGELQRINDGNVEVERSSFYGPKSGTCV